MILIFWSHMFCKQSYIINLKDFSFLSISLTPLLVFFFASVMNLDTMISMQLKHFTTIPAPVYYTSGNHELDPLRAAL